MSVTTQLVKNALSALREAKELVHVLVHPSNGYCNQCDGHWLCRCDGTWDYREGEHTLDCPAQAFYRALHTRINL